MVKKICFAMLLTLGLAPLNSAWADLIAVTNSSCTAVAVTGVAGGNSALYTGYTNNTTYEGPTNLLDGKTSTKYCTQNISTNVGFYITLTTAAVVSEIQFATANDTPGRDPLTITIEGSNATTSSDLLLGSSWTEIYSGAAGLDSTTARQSYGDLVSFSNTTSYTSYRVLVTSVRTSSSTLMQISEVKLFGEQVPEPSTTVLLGGGLIGLLAYAWRKRKKI
jgi:hypothetical protein